MRVVLLAALLSVATPAIAIPETGSATASATDALLRREADSGQAAFEALWERVLTQGNITAVQQTYDLVAALYHERWEVSAADCSKHEADIASALEINPVGFALRYVAYECAVVTNQPDLAARHKAEFDNLVRHSMQALPKDNYGGASRPIRVLNEIDAYAFARAAGEKVSFAHYDIYPAGRYMPLEMTLWNEKAQRERVLGFDFFDSLMRMRKDPDSAFGISRKDAARDLLSELGTQFGTPAYEANVFFNGSEKFPDNPSRLNWARKLAKEGNYIATLGFVAWCFEYPDAKCDKEATEFLTPLVRRGNTVAMIMLAPFYEDGRGVAVDPAAARALIGKVDARRGDHEGLLEFAIYRLDSNDGAIDPLVRADVEQLAQTGNAAAVTLVAGEIGARTEHYVFEPKLRSNLEKAADAGDRVACYLRAKMLFEQGDDAGGLLWLREGAELGNEVAMGTLADIYRDASRGARYDLDRALYWYEQSAQRGETRSARLAGYVLWREFPYSQENHYRAQRWLQDAAAAGDEVGTFDLAQMYEEGGVGIEGGAEQAAHLYRWLIDKEPGDAETRWFLARLLRDGKVAEKEPGELQRLLQEAVTSGDAEHLRYLGYDLLYGGYGASDPEEAANWYKLAAAKGDNSSRSVYALMLLDGVGVTRDVNAAFSQFRTAIEDGSIDSLANMALALCTHEQSDIYEPKEGLLLANKLIAKVRTANDLETLGACQAANGQFQQAIASAHAAMGLIEQRHTRSYVTAAQDIRDELASYEAGKRYVWPEPILRTRIRRAQALLEPSLNPAPTAISP